MRLARRPENLRLIPFLLIGAVLCPSAAGKVIYVDDDATGANDGTSWVDAYVYLQDALVDANDSEKPVEIHVAKGIYKPDRGIGIAPGDRTARFELINGVAIRGGYAGYGEAYPDGRDSEAHKTILSGDLNGDDVEVSDPCDLLDAPTRAENSYIVVTSWRADATAVLDSCTITGGNANWSYRVPPYRFGGGGMFNLDSSVMVTDCTFTGNSAELCGAMSNVGWFGNCNVTVMRCVFTHNAAREAGGMGNKGESLGMCNPTITDCTFVGNWARNAGGMLNRGDYLSPGRTSPILANCTFNGNSAMYSGGGMRNDNSDPRLTNCTFTGNSVESNDGEDEDGGGGMYNMDSSPTLSNCSFRGNSADYGGGICNTKSSPNLTNCTFTGNSADWGAGMQNSWHSHVKLINCRFSGNWAGVDGGGMHNSDDCRPTLTECTFNSNFAGSRGGGMANDASGDNCAPTLIHCTFSHNEADLGGGMYNLGSDGTCNPTLTRCTFTANAARIGGGMCGSGGEDGLCSATLTNCTFTGNVARSLLGCGSSGGGGICCQHDSHANLTNCAFSRNRAMESGGAVYVDKEAVAILTSCILWNDQPNEIHLHQLNGVAVATYCDIADGWPGETNFSKDPHFVASGHWDPNGTPEDTNNDFWVDGDYHLKSEAGRWDPLGESWVIDDITSPCIDAGDPNSPVAFEPFPNGGIVNMGAYGGTAEASKSPSGLHAKYGGGSGEPDDPFLIYTAEQMNEIGLHEDDWDKHFKLMADVDLSAFTGADFNIIGYYVDWDDNKPFRGTLDGGGHTISNFSYTGTDRDSIGLFGYILLGAEIKDLGLKDPNIDAGTGHNVGSLVGYLNRGTITNCYAKGISVSGESNVGGLVGRSTGSISSCYSAGYVNGVEEVGGLVGRNYTNMLNCYSTSYVNGSREVGGLAGWNGDSSISNCYSTGDVSGDWDVGGIVGYNNFGSIMNCYSTGDVSGDWEVGGLVGYNLRGSVIKCFWDIEKQTHGVTVSTGHNTGTIANVVGQPTALMQTRDTFTDAGWDFIDEQSNGTAETWQMPDGGGYPVLSLFLIDIPFPLSGNGSADEPYLITDANELGMISWYPDGSHFELTRDIDLSGIHWSVAVVPIFTGCFDGGSHIIRNMEMSGGGSLGLFGYLGEMSWVRNLGLEGGSVNGTGEYVGSLVGVNDDGTLSNCYSTVNVDGNRIVGGLVGKSLYDGSVSNCYSTGDVSGADWSVGGLVGFNLGSVSNCYSTGDVSGNEGVGGLVGNNGDEGSVCSCYSTGDVSGNEGVGGLVGDNDNVISHCYSAGDVNGLDKVGGLAGGNQDGAHVNCCYSTGTVSGEDKVGGLVGYNNEGSVRYCYSTGYTTGTGLCVGGLVGENEEGDVWQCFWNIQTSGQIASDAGTGKTTTEMQTASTFLEAGWDFVDETENGTDDIWWILKGQDYPRLWWELDADEEMSQAYR